MSTGTQGVTRYSDEVPGAEGNYHWPASFSVTDGYVLISQSKELGTDAVLLSPAQYRALVAFVEKRR